LDQFLAVTTVYSAPAPTAQSLGAETTEKGTGLLALATMQFSFAMSNSIRKGQIRLITTSQEKVCSRQSFVRVLSSSE
jgi:hypothetical protein